MLQAGLGTSRSAPRQLAFDVIVEDGPHVAQRTGFPAVRLEPERASPLLIGQSPACELRIEDASVSRRHVSLEVTGSRVRVVDLGSTNGTFVNELAIGEAWLTGGERVRIGDTTLRLVPSETEAAKAPLSTAARFGRLIGASVSMRRLYPLFQQLAACEIPVVIEGETGTGKEVLAEAIHEESARASSPFVVFDCTAVPPTLMESELFGHERGAFTTALAQRKGVFEQAHGGTLLIDEIGDLDISLQPKLLRVLDRGEVRRVGGDKAIKVDVRLLAATRRDLDREVQEGRFRDDLFHRLAVARVELPALRRRRGDVTLLARHFWQLLADDSSPPADLLARWEGRPWPGNIRELRNAVSRQVALGALATDRDAAADDAPQPTAGDTVERVLRLGLPLPEARHRVVEDFERRYVARLLDEHAGDVRKAARASGIARRYFQLIKARTRQT